jgi:hypothetical protein
MAKILTACVVVVLILGFAATAFPADVPQGVPGLKCNPAAATSPAAVTPAGTTNCGTYSCRNNGTCCDNNTCCPSGYNLYCRSNNKCYTDISAAKRDCGDSYFICWVPAK